MSFAAIENFDHVDKIDYYVITMRPEDRVKNIELQQSKINESVPNVKIEYVDAVVGKDINIDKLKENGMLVVSDENNFNKNVNNMKNELGCYLSHMKIYEMIASKGKSGFSVIFEDDFELDDGFIEKLEESADILKMADFDFCFLGMLGGEGGAHLKGDLYRIPDDGTMWGTHAYMIKNENVEKIMRVLTPIRGIIDVSIFDKGKSKELNVYTLQPTIAQQNGFGTSIRME